MKTYNITKQPKQRNDQFTTKIVVKGDSDYDKAYQLALNNYQKFLDVQSLTPPTSYFVLQDNTTKEITACFSVTLGENSPLFSEHYLNASFEDTLKSLGNAVSRKQVCEIGQLAAINTAQSIPQLFCQVALYLGQIGIKYILFTTHSQGRYLLQKLQFPFHYLGKAKEEDLPVEQQGKWGSYYQKNVEVAYLKVEELIAPALAFLERTKTSKEAA